MTYLVEFAARAARDLEILYEEKNATESHAAARWYNGLEEAVYALASFPQRRPVAPEAARVWAVLTLMVATRGMRASERKPRYTRLTTQDPPTVPVFIDRCGAGRHLELIPSVYTQAPKK
jgi:hypothetical protein